NRLEKRVLRQKLLAPVDRPLWGAISCHADATMPAAENIGSMARAIHPRADRFARGPLPHGDVFGDRTARGRQRSAVGHPGRMRSGALHQSAIDDQWRQTMPSTLGVGLFDNVAFDLDQPIL